MSYEKQTFIDNETVLKAEHLNHIEDGIETVDVRANVKIVYQSNFETWVKSLKSIGFCIAREDFDYSFMYSDVEYSGEMHQGDVYSFSPSTLDLNFYFNCKQVETNIDGFIELTNLYNPALQTNDTISPHYYVDGVPYSSTQYDANYNATALIEIEPSTTYTIVLIPGAGSPTEGTTYTVPWARATQGLFFYDENENFISQHSNGNTFTTPSNAKYIRFNYAIIFGIDLTRLNNTCVLVKYNAVPPQYIPYGEKLTIQDPSTLTESNSQCKVYFQTVEGGIYVNAPYSADNDICFYLCKKGPNSIFDFSTIGLVAAADPVSNVISPTSYIVSSSGDWHAPYVVSAVNNGDGDNTSSYYFTGGNHGYDNTANGVATARTDNLKMYADGKALSAGESGYCNSIKLEWDNYVQGFNTTKSDGSGREILREHITMVFDGEKWFTETTIYPLEDIRIQTWYGLQTFTANYNYVVYIGGESGLIYEKANDSDSGNSDTNAIKLFNLNDTSIVEIDTNYDLGKRKYAQNTTKSFFARGSYNKAYGTIVGSSADFSSGGSYSMRGSYMFKHEVQQTPASSNNSSDSGNTGTETTTSLLNLNRTESNSSNSYLAGNNETYYINPAKSNSVAVSGTPCVVADLTENSITVTENGTGSTGCAFPVSVTNNLGKSLTFSWNSNGGSNTRMFLTCFGNSNAKYIQIDKTGSKTSCVIEISEDGNTITVDGVATASNGNPFTAMCFFFGSATGTTTSYTNVSLVEQE